MNTSRHPKDVADWLAQSGTTWPMLTVSINYLDEYLAKLAEWNLKEWRDWVMLSAEGPFGNLTGRRIWIKDPAMCMMLKLTMGEHA